MLRPLQDWKKWTGYDFYIFFSVVVGLVCTDPTNLPDREFYEALREFSNAISLMYHERFSMTIYERAKRAVENFATFYKERFGVELCTWKFHMFQHLHQYLLAHGSGMYTDSFNVERVIGGMVRSVTSRRNQVAQIVSNHLLKFHSRPLDCIHEFDKDVIKFLVRIGASKRTNARFTKKALNKVEGRVGIREEEELRDHGVLDVGGDVAQGVTRVDRLKVGKVMLTSTLYNHTGRIWDSFVFLNDRDPAQILDMFAVSDTTERFFLKVRLFQKIPTMKFSVTGPVVNYPDYQFPAVELDEVKYLEVTSDLLVMKAMPSPYTRPDTKEDCTFLSVLTTSLF